MIMVLCSTGCKETNIYLMIEIKLKIDIQKYWQSLRNERQKYDLKIVIYIIYNTIGIIDKTKWNFDETGLL